jgi:DNA-directed RNA polymerase specialized sigma24 family protein
MTYREFADRELMLIANEKNRDAIIVVIYERHHKRLRALAKKKTENCCIAEDAVQDAFIQFMRASNWNGIEHLGKWLDTITLRRVKDLRIMEENRKKYQEGFSDFSQGQVNPQNEYDIHVLEINALNRLKAMHENHRLVFYFRLIRFLDDEEISVLTGLKIGTVRNYIWKVGQELRLLTQEYKVL